ncbi:YkgJ family cysteine cluster protein [Leptolyngbya ohadii]|uniref:YkgJ family cysteine cluster protein n=1 Tax=Leptolyngbya ohadii TaxID=1962290 RepID=UPI0015C62A61|nr:YkgJ family cysteine cluster protein [Leptolyngbya ohadii]
MNELRQQLHNLDQRIESRVQAIRAERDGWLCKRGCDYCCRHLDHPPDLTAIEWERVDAAVAQLPVSEQAIVEQKINALLQQIAEGNLGLSVVCPYLNEQEGACRIYDARPIACRTYGFFAARHEEQYCQQIRDEIAHRGEGTIVWGNAEAIRKKLEQIGGAAVSFEQHYGD